MNIKHLTGWLDYVLLCTCLNPTQAEQNWQANYQPHLRQMILTDPLLPTHLLGRFACFRAYMARSPLQPLQLLLQQKLPCIKNTSGLVLLPQ